MGEVDNSHTVYQKNGCGGGGEEEGEKEEWF